MLAELLVLALASPAPPDLAAIGVVVSPRPGRSVALLRSGGRTRIAAVGETAFGGRVVRIQPGLVVLEFDSGPLELRLPSDGTPRAGPPPARTPADAPRAADPDARSMPRHEVERRLGEEIPRILAETTLTPVTDEGQVKGFALTRLPEGSLLSDAGLRPGDVLTRINDVPIDSLATLLGLWPRLQSESELRAVVLRNGLPVSLTVTLR